MSEMDINRKQIKIGLLVKNNIQQYISLIFLLHVEGSIRVMAPGAMQTHYLTKANYNTGI